MKDFFQKNKLHYNIDDPKDSENNETDEHDAMRYALAGHEAAHGGIGIDIGDEVYLVGGDNNGHFMVPNNIMCADANLSGQAYLNHYDEALRDIQGTMHVSRISGTTITTAQQQQTPNHLRGCPHDIENGAQIIPPNTTLHIEHSPPKFYITKENFHNYKWAHIQDEIKTKISENGDKLISKGIYRMQGYIPLQVDRPIIKYFENEDKISLKRPSKYNRDEHSQCGSTLCFSFKNKKMNIYKCYEGSVQTVIDLHKELTEFFFPAFTSKFRALFHSIKIQDLVGKSLEKDLDKYSYYDISAIQVITRHLGELLIEKAYQNKVIDKDDYKTLQNSFNIIMDLKPDYLDTYGYKITGNEGRYGILNKLLFQLKYRPYLSLLALCKTPEEHKKHWDQMHFSQDDITPYTYAKLSKQFKTLLLNEDKIDKFVYKITGHENKSALKNVMSELLYDKKYITLDIIMACKNYIHRNWIIEFYKQNNYVYERSLMDLCRQRKNLNVFMKEYLTNKKLKREFFEVFIGNSCPLNVAVSNYFQNDILNMYFSLPQEIRPQGISLYNLHDELCNRHDQQHQRESILNRAQDIIAQSTFLDLHANKIRTSKPIKFKYKKGKFQNLLHLNKTKIKDYVIRIPQKSDELIEAGRELDNCLSSYVSQVQNGACLILLIQNKNKENKYAVEIKNDNKEFYVNQYYGHKNSMPEKEDFIMFRDFIREQFEKTFEKIEKTKETT